MRLRCIMNCVIFDKIKASFCKFAATCCRARRRPVAASGPESTQEGRTEIGRVLLKWEFTGWSRSGSWRTALNWRVRHSGSASR